MASASTLTNLNKKILSLLQQNPAGLTIYEIRERLADNHGIQQHLDRRVRDLRSHYEIKLASGGKYRLLGARSKAATDSGKINAKLRAAVLNVAHGRCQMCGMSVANDHIKLQVDHKVPQNWGGPSEMDNLWAICQLCNGGKRDFFKSFNSNEMKKIAALESVYSRIFGVLKINSGKPVPSWLLEFVANLNDFQEDWQKRLRELRYPVIGMKISSTRSKTKSGKWQAAYRLDDYRELPSDHKFKIKQYELHSKKKLRQRD